MVCDDATGPWSRKVLNPITSKVGPVWKKLERKVQAKIDSLPPGVSSFLDVKTSESSAWLVCLLGCACVRVCVGSLCSLCSFCMVGAFCMVDCKLSGIL